MTNPENPYEPIQFLNNSRGFFKDPHNQFFSLYTSTAKTRKFQLVLSNDFIPFIAFTANLKTSNSPVKILTF